LIAYFPYRNTGVLSSRDQSSPDYPYHLRAFFFSGRQGGQTASMDWPALESSHLAILSAAGGRFLVFTGTSLELYSEQHVKIKEYPIERTENETREYRTLSVGPDGETALLIHSLNSPSSNHYHFDLLRTDTLEPVFQSDGNLSTLSFSGDRFTARTGNIVWMHAAKNDPVMIYQAPRTICWEPTFVSLDTYIIAERTRQQCDSFELISIDGRPLLEQRFEGEELSNLTSTVNGGSHGHGSAFAISSQSLRGGHFDTTPTVTRERIRVYDIASRQLIAALDVNPLPKVFFTFTVSPDGSLLAVLTDTTLRVYRLPSLQSH